LHNRVRDFITCIKRVINNPRKIIFILALNGCFKSLPDKMYLKLIFYAKTGRKLNVDNPNTYNEKLQWLKIYDRRSEQTKYVDKYEVREYIKETIGEKYLVHLLGVYDSFDEINFEELPNKFVLKCTHDSGGLVICKDKSKLDLEVARRKINNCLKRNFYYYGREWPYKSVKPKIICEQYLQENITDYKFMCFGGEPKLIQIHRNRGQANHTLDFYDVNWNKSEIRRETSTASNILERPLLYDEMLYIARKLSENEIHVRVDLYEVDGKIYFGEKTYYSASGFSLFAKDEYDELLGSWIQLPIDNK